MSEELVKLLAKKALCDESDDEIQEQQQRQQQRHRQQQKTVKTDNEEMEDQQSQELLTVKAEEEQSVIVLEENQKLCINPSENDESEEQMNDDRVLHDKSSDDHGVDDAMKEEDMSRVAMRCDASSAIAGPSTDNCQSEILNDREAEINKLKEEEKQQEKLMEEMKLKEKAPEDEMLTEDKRLLISEVEAQVKALVECEQSFEEIKKELLVDLETELSEEDRARALLDNLYMENLLESLPNKLSGYFESLFNQGHPSHKMRWLKACVEDLTEDNIYGLFEARFDEVVQGEPRLKAKFAANFRDVSRRFQEEGGQDDSHRLAFSGMNQFVKETRSHFFKAFDRRTELTGELGIYRSLRVCSNFRRSQLFCSAVQDLWSKLHPYKSERPIEPDKDADEQIEHGVFANVVKNLQKNFPLRHDFVRKQIEDLFKPLHWQLIDNGRVLEFSDRNIKLSTALQKYAQETEKELETETEIQEVCFVAEMGIDIDSDFKMPSKNIVLAAKEINVSSKVDWDLSGAAGKSSIGKPTKAAKGQPGVPGRDGTAGESSGTIYAMARAITNSERWTVRLCGGDGSPGQDGGDGGDGEDGKSKQYTEDVDFGSRLTVKTVNDVKQITCSFEPNCFPSSPYHDFAAFLGSEGKPGGRGGQNGNGGEGGKKGRFVVFGPGESKVEHSVSVVAEEGKAGAAGEPGKTGTPGKDGSDFACANSWFAPKEYFDTKNNDSKIRFKFGDSNDTKYYYAPGLCTYLKEKSLPTEGEGDYVTVVYAGEPQRKVLAESEARAAKKRDSERQGQAIAKNTASINVKAIAEKYRYIFETHDEARTAEKSTEAEIGRLAVRIDVPQEAPYLAKKRIQLPILEANMFQQVFEHPEAIVADHAMFNVPFNSSQTKKLLRTCNVSSLPDRLKKKLLASRLRVLDMKQTTPWQSPGDHLIPRQQKAPRRIQPNLEQRWSNIKAELQKRNRDCFPYLSPTDHSRVRNNVYDLLCDANMARSFISDALDKALQQRLTLGKFIQLNKLFDNFKTLQLARNY